MRKTLMQIVFFCENCFSNFSKRMFVKAIDIWFGFAYNGNVSVRKMNFHHKEETYGKANS